MRQLPKISDAEWQVMKVIWSESPATANDVIKKLDGVIAWNDKTIKTLLGRLVKKGAISYQKEGRTYVYYPLVSEEECIKAENRSFLKRVYDGALSVMFVNFLEQHKLSQKEIEELKEILDKKGQ
ncbi:BlaI/MecI/CopY family transcriptional regulator [Peptococcaceae bacterium 1198_IL3148]